MKSHVLAQLGLPGLLPKQKKPLQLGSMGSGTQLTQVTWVQKPSLPSLAGLIKTLKAGFQLGLLCSLPKQQYPESWVRLVLKPSFGFIKTNKKLGFSQKAKCRFQKVPSQLYINIRKNFAQKEKLASKNINYKTLTRKQKFLKPVNIFGYIFE